MYILTHFAQQERPPGQAPSPGTGTRALLGSERGCSFGVTGYLLLCTYMYIWLLFLVCVDPILGSTRSMQQVSSDE